MLCAIARVTRSGYYASCDRQTREERDKESLDIIKEAKSHSFDGYRTVTMNIKKEDHMNHKKVQRIMRENMLSSDIRKSNPYRKMAKKTEEHKVFPNILERKYRDVLTPYLIFCEDITYLKYGGNTAYLNAIRDAATGEIVAYKMSKQITHGFVLETLNMLKDNIDSKILSNALIHTDQGWHYSHPTYVKAVKDIGMIQSMSRKGNCWDNAPIESFFGHLKDELGHRQCSTFEELNNRVDEHIIYHNTERKQWNRKKMTPVEYRNHLLIA